MTLDIQIPLEDRWLNPKTSPFRRVWRVRGSFDRDPHQVFGGFWMSRAINDYKWPCKYGCVQK